MTEASERGPATRAAFAIGTLVAAAIVLGSAGFDIERTARGDGEIARYIARNLTIDPEDVHPVVEERGTSLRFGRIGVPAATWLLAGGRPGLMGWTHALLMILSGSAAAAAIALLVPRAGPAVGLLAFAAPGFTVSLTGGFVDAPAVALSLWAIVAAARGWALRCATFIAAGLLVKESVLVVAVGLGVWTLLRRRPSLALAIAGSAIPLGIWYLVVRARYGHIPLLDPYLDDFDGHVGTPGVALVRGLADPPSAKGAVTAWFHVGLGIGSVALARTSLFGLLAAVSAVQVLTAGPFAWEFIGEAFRVFALLQVLLVLAVVVRVRPGWVLPAVSGLRAAD